MHFLERIWLRAIAAVACGDGAEFLINSHTKTAPNRLGSGAKFTPEIECPKRDKVLIAFEKGEATVRPFPL